MTATIPCPGCRTPLTLEQTSCPICLRGRTRQEIMRGYAALRESEARRKRRPFVVAGWLAAAAALAWGFWRFRAPLAAGVDAAKARAAKLADDATDPRTYAASRPGAPRATPVETAAAASGAAAPTPSPFGSASGAPPAPARPAPAPAAAAPAEPAAPEAAPKRRAPKEPSFAPVQDIGNQWALYGTVFDVLTLKRAPGVRLAAKAAFGDRSSTPLAGPEIVTDEDGNYSVILPRMADARVEITAADRRYAAAVLHEADIPYRSLSAEDRRAMAENARAGDVQSTGIVDAPGEEAVRRDLFLVPRR